MINQDILIRCAGTEKNAQHFAVRNQGLFQIHVQRSKHDSTDGNGKLLAFHREAIQEARTVSFRLSLLSKNCEEMKLCRHLMKSGQSGSRL